MIIIDDEKKLPKMKLNLPIRVFCNFYLFTNQHQQRNTKYKKLVNTLLTNRSIFFFTRGCFHYVRWLQKIVKIKEKTTPKVVTEKVDELFLQQHCSILHRRRWPRQIVRTNLLSFRQLQCPCDYLGSSQTKFKQKYINVQFN